MGDMRYAERIHLRSELLGELYAHYFGSDGGRMSILECYQADKENRLAYIYLEDMGYLIYDIERTRERELKNVTAIITARGINIIEQEGLAAQLQAFEQFPDEETEDMTKKISTRERVLQRQAILEDLYDHHFATGATAYIVEDFEGADLERRLAYQYLAEKGHVDLFVDENGVNAQIRVAGIEAVEGSRFTVH